jgi:transcriptional regulator with XRE-family HTH domain
MAKPRKFQRTAIRQWRKHRKLTLEGLAQRMGMTPSHLSMLERGQRGYTQGTLEAVAKALRTDVGSLIRCDPTEADTIWATWDRAKPAHRRRIIDAAKALINS